MNYYNPYFEGEEEAAGYYMNPYFQGQPTQPYMSEQMWNCSQPPEKKGVRKKNPEREEDRIKYVIKLEDILNKKDCRTTLMIKNIPNKYNQNMLLKKVEESNKGQYNFFYLPIDFNVRLHFAIIEQL